MPKEMVHELIHPAGVSSDTEHRSAPWLLLLERTAAVSRAAVAVGLILLFGSSWSVASAHTSALAKMQHTEWTARDGAPQGITALAQATDGILWIGSEGGLFSFDGRSFSAFQSPAGDQELPAGAVSSVFATRDGSVWVGFNEGGLVRISQGRVARFSNADGQPLYGIQYFSQSTDGSVWALCAHQRVVRFGSDRLWHVEPLPAGSSGGRIRAIFIDSSNTLWLAQAGRLYRRSLPQPLYEASDVQADFIFGFAEAPDRSIWISDVMTDVDRGRIQHIDRFGKLLSRLPDTDEAQDILYMSDGSLIVAVQDHGLRRLHAEALQDKVQDRVTTASDGYTHLDGLSSDSAKALLIDVDGNLWVGGARGLDRFKKAQLIPFVGKTANATWQVCAGKRGEVWVANKTNELFKVSGGTPQSFPNVGDIYSLFCRDDGDAWIVDHTGIWQVHNDHIQLVPPIPGVIRYGVHAIAATKEHTLFAAVGNGQVGLWRYQDNAWTRITTPPVATPVVCYIDSQDRLWTGYRDGSVGLPLEGTGNSLSSGSPGLGVVYAITETSHGMFAAGLNGLAVLGKHGFEMLEFADRASSRGVSGLLESGNGDLWLNASHGIVHIQSSELQAALSDPRYPIKSELVTEGEFVGPARLWPGASSAARDSEGNLWFVMLNSLVHLDPEHLNSEGHLPRLSIRSVTVDRDPLDATRIIGPRPQTLDIQYLGVNLSAPDKVIYRYRLEGFENSWQDAGHRTDAIYTRLRPGTFTFQVAASNGNGKWTEPVSAAPFVVMPSFYQTLWFAIVGTLAGLLLLWIIFMSRVRAITRAIRVRAEERADERIRISRDLHDTLLQGIQGLLLTFHVAAQRISSNDDSKVLLEKALATADRIIVEGRNRVTSLRSEHMNDAELVGALENVGKDLNLNGGVQFHLRRTGIEATLQSHVADEVFNMAREALTNAHRHAQATRIDLELKYGRRYFSFSCRDDGQGFEPQAADKSGHFGLKGIAERARRLGGQLQYRSKPQEGTEIRLEIPSYRAYENYSRLMFHLRAFCVSERSQLSR